MKKTVLVSDLSGAEIEDGKGATVSINFRDARRGTIVLDSLTRKPRRWGAKVAVNSGGGEGPKLRDRNLRGICLSWARSCLMPAGVPKLGARPEKSAICRQAANFGTSYENCTRRYGCRARVDRVSARC